MAERNLTIKKTEEFAEWYANLGETLKARIDARLERLKSGHFGDSRTLGDSLFELKWKNGMRVYCSYTKIDGVDVIILWGGDKGSQKSDIKKARGLKELYEAEYEDQD